MNVAGTATRGQTDAVRGMRKGRMGRVDEISSGAKVVSARFRVGAGGAVARLGGEIDHLKWSQG